MAQARAKAQTPLRALLQVFGFMADNASAVSPAATAAEHGGSAAGVVSEPDWTMYFDDVSGLPFWFNSRNGVRKWLEVEEIDSLTVGEMRRLPRISHVDDTRHTANQGAAAEHATSLATEQAVTAPAGTERRIAADDTPYTYAEFASWYGPVVADRKWALASNIAEHWVPPAAAEHWAPAASGEDVATQATPAPHGTAAGQASTLQMSPSLAASPSAMVPVVEQDAQNVPQESAPVLLAPEDIHTLISAERARAPPRDLHKLARTALNTIARSGPQNAVTRDLHGCFPWKEYIACHPNASRIIGAGVVRALAEFSATTKDPNRGGQPRLDFVFYAADGSFARLHPGSTQQQDAQPFFSSGKVAAEHLAHTVSARSHWSSAPALPFTFTQAQTIPQIDRIGKAAAFESLQLLPLGLLPVDEPSSFQWWLYACNLGTLTASVFGEGIVSAVLEEKTFDFVQLLFTRADGNFARIRITQHHLHGSFETRMLR